MASPSINCGLCGIDNDSNGTVDFHGIVHVGTEPYETSEPVKQDYDFWVDYMPLLFAFLVAVFILVVGTNIVL